MDVNGGGSGTISGQRRSRPPSMHAVLWVHNDAFSKEPILVNYAVFPAETRRWLAGPLKVLLAPKDELRTENIHSKKPRDQLVFLPRDASEDTKKKQPNLQISVSQRIATLYGFANRDHVQLLPVERDDYAATHVEILVRNALSRADLWSFLTTEVSRQNCLYEGQQLLYLGTARALVRKVYRGGMRVRSALYGPQTQPIFRSESARMMIGIQLSREMWMYDSNAPGSIVWEHVVTFLHTLFSRWTSSGSRHLVTVVLFSRVEPLARTSPTSQQQARFEEVSQQPLDFYRVVVSEASNTDRAQIMLRLRQRFEAFRLDLAAYYRHERSEFTVNIEPSSGKNGNILEAVNLLASQSVSYSGDPTFFHYGTSIIILTPVVPVFNVDENLLRLTTERLNNSAISVDLVSLCTAPLHVAPLFRWERSGDGDNLNDIPNDPGPNIELRPGSREEPLPDNKVSGIVNVIPSWAGASFFSSESADRSALKHKRPPLGNHPTRCWLHDGPNPEDEINNAYIASSDDKNALYSLSEQLKNGESDNNAEMYHRLLVMMRQYDKTSFSKRIEMKREGHVRVKSLEIPRGRAAANKTRTSSASRKKDTNDSVVPSHQQEAQQARRSSRASVISDDSAPNRPPSSTRNATAHSGSIRSGLRIGSFFGGTFGKATATTGATVTPVNTSGSTYAKPGDDANDGGSVSKRFRMSLARQTSFTSIEQAMQKPPGKLRSQSSSETVRANDSVMSQADADSQRPEDIDANSTLDGVLSKQTSAEDEKPIQVPVQKYQAPSKEAFSPWIIIKDPHMVNELYHAPLGIWKHTSPLSRGPASKIAWRSLESPAVLPFESEARISLQTLREYFTENPYKLAVSGAGEPNFTIIDLAREMLQCRFFMGYQIVANPFILPLRGGVSESSPPGLVLQNDGDSALIVRGDYVQLLSLSGDEVSVVRYALKSTPPKQLNYEYMIQTEVSTDFRAQRREFSPTTDLNWNRIDHQILESLQDLSVYRQHVQWASPLTQRARFVLIPVEISKAPRQGSNVKGEDDDEEIRLEGIRKLTVAWQKYRHLAADVSEVSAAWEGHEDPNPLAIEFQTRDASVVVTAGLENSLLTEGQITVASTRLFSETDLYRTSNFDMQRLSQDLQGEKGLRIQDRRWHFRMHYRCFVGVELTSWLLANFQDLQTREEAVEFGNLLMNKSLFTHVQKRHRFRDGNYFFSISPEYRTNKSETKSSNWFGPKKSGHSVPSTPALSAVREEKEEVKASPEPREAKRPRVALTAAIQYDLDHRKRSQKPEMVTIHYDRLHNPENAYHFQLEWTNATTRLVEDAVASWTANVERYGLKLVQLPLYEVSAISNLTPLRLPYRIELAVQPPDALQARQANESIFGLRIANGPNPYMRALLRRQNYILDMEAESSFPQDVEIYYSWSIPPYRCTQFIHRSGLLLAQIAPDGSILLLANRLHTMRTGGAGGLASAVTGPSSAKHEKISELSALKPHDSPAPHINRPPTAVGAPSATPATAAAVYSCLTAEQLKDDLERFCSDAAALTAFFDQVSEPLPLPSSEHGTPATHAASGPSSSRATPSLQASVPSLTLPSPSFKPIDVDGVASPLANVDELTPLAAPARNVLHNGKIDGEAKKIESSGGSSAGDEGDANRA